MNKPVFLTNNDWELLNKKYKNIEPIIKKINNNYPVQYLIGDVDFYGNKILVNKNVLIPRFETETLVEKTIKYIKKNHLEEECLLEVGTGSGCISITLKKELPKLSITSIDISNKALTVAKKNAKLNKTKITFINHNMKNYRPITKYSILVSNPPYIALDETIDPKTKYEPQNALYAKDDGLEYYKVIFNNCKYWLNEKHLLTFEIGEKQGKKLLKLAKKSFPNDKAVVEKDLAGKDRYLIIINE